MFKIGSLFRNLFNQEIRDRGISQKSLSERTGIDPATLSLKLSGKRRLTEIDLDKIANGLEIKVGLKKEDN